MSAKSLPFADILQLSFSGTVIVGYFCDTEVDFAIAVD